MKRALFLAVAASLASPLAAQAQSASLASARASLASYDTSGTRTFDALRSLGPVAAGGGADAREATYLRAVAATDMHILALGLGDTTLDARLADAMGVPHERLSAELHTELASAQAGVFRAPAAAELALLTHAESFVAGPSALDTHNAREAGLFVLGVGRAARAHDFGAISVPTGTEPTPTWLAGPGASGLGAVRAGLLAYDRATRGVRDGDPLLSAWSSALDSSRDALFAYEMHAPPSAGDIVLAAADGDTTAAMPDVLLVIEPTHVLVACGARAHATSATELATTQVSATCPAAGTLQAIALPASLPTVPQPIDELVRAFGALGLPAGTVIAIAPLETTPMHILTRVLRSLARANLSPTLVAFAAGTELRTQALALAAAADVPSVTVHVRLGGYAIERTRGHDAQVPRIHATSGLVYDRAGLSAALAHDTVSAATVDGMGPVPAVEVLRAIRTLASSGARVTLALP